VVLIGTVYPYGRPQSERVREDHRRQPHTFKGRMRLAQEELLLAAARAGRIKATVLRLPDFYGPGVDKSFLHSAFVAAAQSGTANLIGPIDRPHEFVFVSDVGPVAVRLAQTPEAYGRVWHFAGAGVTSQQAIVREIERQTGRPVKLRTAGKATLRLLGLFTPMLREMVEMHYLLTDPVLMDDRALERLIGPLKKTSYEQGIRLTLSALLDVSKPESGLTAKPKRSSRTGCRSNATAACVHAWRLEQQATSALASRFSRLVRLAQRRLRAATRKLNGCLWLQQPSSPRAST